MVDRVAEFAFRFLFVFRQRGAVEGSCITGESFSKITDSGNGRASERGKASARVNEGDRGKNE